MRSTVRVNDEKLLFRTLSAAFAMRRKTLLNALSSDFSHISKDKIANVITECGFEPTVRGERLSISDFARISDKLGKIATESVQ